MTSHRYPKLSVLIGRMDTVDVDQLEQANFEDADVRIITYDEILEQQRSLLVATAPRTA